MDYTEVSKHTSQESCWVILYGEVYDVTEYLPNHPGGSKIILQLAGKDATEEFDPIHPPGTLAENLPSSAKLGTIDESTLPTSSNTSSSSTSTDVTNSAPPLDTLLNLTDIETAAASVLPKRAWAYYFSGADDLHSKEHNSDVYRRILLRPRIFIDVTHCSTRTTFLGHPVNVPFFVSPAAMARLAHPEGEKAIGAACARWGAVQVISNNASLTPEQIVEDAKDGSVFGWQMYVQTERKKSETMLERISKLDVVKFIVLTLDVPVQPKREIDERVREGGMEGTRAAIQDDDESGKAEGEEKKASGIGQALFAGTAPDLTWRTTLPWLAKHTSLPIILKGVATHEDAYLASLHPQIKGIVLSNHGGRALDTSPPAVHTLLEIHKYCPSVFSRLEVFVDGGIKRGTDVIKALCLGAKGVGLGRAPLWALAVGGQQGVERAFEVLDHEIRTAMGLMGVGDVRDLGRRFINTRAVENEIFNGDAGLEETSLQALAERAKL